MFEAFRNAWKVRELRTKILFTVLVIVIYRLGSSIPVPFLDAEVLRNMASATSGTFLGYMDILSGGALSKGTLFAMSITPYINASIIIQLLTFALPPLERLQKEGETGRKRIQKITDFVALGIALFQATAYYFTLRNTYGAVTSYGDTFSNIFAAAVIIGCFTAGASLIVWLGNQINDKGIGNGISIVLFAGIIARGPDAIIKLISMVVTDPGKYAIAIPVVIIVFILMIGFIVFMNASERRIPVQYAKRVVGRKQYGGMNTHIPIKVSMSGVMPIIFAMSFMSLPSTLALFFPPTGGEGFWQKFYAGFLKFFSYESPWYALIYFLLIIGFNYFYVSMQYNPVEIANNLRQSNGGIPGIRPGRPTSDYIQRILSKITLVGAFFLGVIAIFPIFFNMAMPDLQIAMGGTSVLIIVTVALETVRTLESQMMMRHHKGFLE